MLHLPIIRALIGAIHAQGDQLELADLLSKRVDPRKLAFVSLNGIPG